MKQVCINETIEQIISRNKVKLLRKFPAIKEIAVENIGYNNEKFYLEKKGKIHIKLNDGAKHYKVIYHINCENGEGTVKIICNNCEDIKPILNNDVVFFIRSDKKIDEILLEFSLDGSFTLNHLEVIEIGLVEYKFYKYRQYINKYNYLLKNDLNFKNRINNELKSNGFKSMLSELRMILTAPEVQEYQMIGKSTYNIDNNKEKMLVVVHEAQKAGATLLSMNIIKTIKRITDYEPIVILLSGGPLEEEFRKQCLVYSLNQTTFSCIQHEESLRKIISEVKELGIKYAICNSIVSALVAKELHDFDINIITLIHELPTSIYNYDFVTSAEYARDYSDKLVFAAKFVRDKYLESFKADSKKCYVVPQGLYANININDIEEKKESKKKLCKKLNINLDNKIVLGCGYGNLRKGIDIFALAAADVIKKDPNIHFVWLGGCDPELQNWISHDMEVQNIGSNFTFVPFEEDPSYFFGGADVFVLSSREDPFPSVALEAMASYTPVVNFENAGGMQETVEDGRGINVPYLDYKKCAEEIIGLLNNKEQAYQIAVNAKKYVSKLTPEVYVKKVIELLMDDNLDNIKFRDIYNVSVIIPNYNYENYLEERLDCIINQTYKPYEIIFLDDCSIDNSIEKAREILQKQDIPFKIIANKVNNGCFRQWIKGINNASGDYVWIAEADDKCELNFLEKVVDDFEDAEVNLSYAQSEIIDENSNKVGFVYTEYTKDLDEHKWNSDYINNGAIEVLDGIGIKNTIPNASGVVMRKSALKDIEDELSKYNIAGDWFTYVYAIKTGKIAFCSDILNYHRRHSKSIISKCEQKIDLFIELMKIKKFIAEKFLIPESIKDRFLNHIPNEYERLSCAGYAKEFEKNDILVKMQDEIENIVNNKIEKYSFLKNKKKKNVLFVAPDLEMGGGQMLVVRLANYLSRFHNTYLYNARPWLKEERVIKMLNKKVNILQSNGDPMQLKSYLQQYNIEAINSHIWWADKIVFKAIKDVPNITHVIGMHGCYEALLEHPDWDGEFLQLVPQIFNRANNIIYATQKNTKIFEVVPTEITKIKKVYYGYELESIPKKDLNSIGISEDSFVFGLVSRAIKEKGWEESIKAIISLNNDLNKKAHLILIGNSEYEKELKEKYAKYDYIHFVDNLTKPSEWIGWVKTFDVGLLPTYFISETLPNTVIEYLAYEVPVISTNIGDIKYMLINDTTQAGIVLELDNGKVLVEDLTQSMKEMINNKEIYNRLKNGTKELFKQFDINNFMEEYYKLF